jgi:tetratricopeptide (TPR) repeat protein
VVLATALVPAAGLHAAGEKAPAPEEVLPEAARGHLDGGRELYRRGDYREALEAFRAAEAAGARSGLLFYQMGFCHKSLGDAAAEREYKEKSIPYFQRQIDDGLGGVDPYYYLAAVYYQDMGEREKGDEVVRKGVAAHRAGRLGEDLPGESLFRLGRLYGFALTGATPGAPPAIADPERAAALEEQRLEAYRRAAHDLLRDRQANRVYLFLSLDEVAAAAVKAGRWDEAIEAYGTASSADPLRPEPGQALLGLGRDLAGRGDMERAVQAWRAIRGPGNVKNQANYALRLGRQVVAHGDLPADLDGRPIAALDRSTLERGILDAAQFLREAESGQFSADPQEVHRQRGLFLALMMSYLEKGNDVRGFTVQHQLVPLVFRSPAR